MVHMISLLLIACDVPPPSGVLEVPTDFCMETRSAIGPDEPTAAGLSAAELAATVPGDRTLDLAWDTASMASFGQLHWTLESAGGDPVFIRRDAPDGGDCGARVELTVRGRLEFADGSAATVDGRLYGSATEAPQFRALDIRPEVGLSLEDALVASLYERNPPGVFEPFSRDSFWFWPRFWVMLDGDFEAGGRLTMINDFTRADLPSQRVVALGEWAPAP